MYVRVKSTPKSPRKTVQIVESFRLDGRVKQKIVKYIGVAANDEELEELKLLANSIKVKWSGNQNSYTFLTIPKQLI